MSEMPNQVSIQGEVSGQIAIGNYINQFQNLNGCNINIVSPDLRPKWERRDTPVNIKPRPPGNFLDRTHEVGLIETSIRSDKPLMMSGVAGIGKSTLLKQLAHLVQTDPFPDGIYSFSAYDLKLEDLLQCLFSAFHESNIPVKPDRAEIQKALQDVRALILIDDLQLTRDETQVILDIAPDCMFIIASAGETYHSTSGTIRLDGLPENDSLLLFEQELGRPLDENEKQPAAEICRLLKGHPENIRWLGARIREEATALDEILAKLNENRAESLLLESVQRLPAVEQQVLAILTGVEGRPLPQEHLFALVEKDTIQQALGNLMARGLVQSHDQAYGVSETVSNVLSQAGERSSWDKMIIDYFVGWLNQRPSASHLAEIQDTLSVLIQKAARRGMWSAVLTLGRAQEPLLIQQGYWQAWHEVLRSMLDASTALGDRALEGWALHQLGSRSLCLGGKEEAVRQLRQALSIRQSIGDQAGAALTQHNLSLILGGLPLERIEEPAAASKALSTAGVGVVTAGIAGVVVLAAVLFYQFFLLRPPVLALPSDEFTQASGSGLTFEWQSVRRAVSYQFEVDDKQDFASPVVDLTTTDIRQVPDVNLEQGIYYWRVRAYNQFDRPGRWSEIRTFTVSIPPAKIHLTQPSNQSIETKPERLVLAWESADNSTSYLVQWDDDSDFSSLVGESQVSENNHSPARALEQGEYYWRVRAFNEYDTPGEWSDPWTLIISIPPNSAPVLVEPDDESKLETTTTPEFRWRSVENANQYRIQVDDSKAFDSPQFDEPVSDVSATSIRALELGVYYWRVQALNVYGTPGDWSDPWTFIISIPPDAPILIQPKQDSIESDTTTPAYEWSRVLTAARYQIQVNDKQNFNSPTYDENVADTTHTPSMHLEQGEYYWRVRAFNEYDTPGDWSDPGLFIVSIPPGAPDLKSPSNKTLLESTNRPAFDWQSVNNASQYQIQVDNSPSFDSPEYQSTDSDTGRRSNQGLRQDVYYWRVRALNKYGTPGAWSKHWEFTVSIPPDTPVLVAPAKDDHVFSGENITFEWKSVSNGAKYNLQVDDSSSFSSLARNITTQGNDTKASFTLSTDTYYWRVRAFNRYGTPGKWSLPRQINVVPQLAAPVLVSPKNKDTVKSSTIPFDWNSVAGASRYRIQVDNNYNFSSPAVSRRTTSTQLQIKLDLGNLACDITYSFTYYWRVRAINEYDMGGPWSPRREFLVVVKRIC